jgi:hypothetical protein
LENVHTGVKIKGIWDVVRKNIKISTKEIQEPNKFWKWHMKLEDISGAKRGNILKTK